MASSVFIGPGLIHQALPVTLTNAQIKALATADSAGAIEFIPAPSAAQVIIPRFVLLTTSFSAGAYTNVNADGAMQILYTGGQDVVWNFANLTGVTTNLSDLLGATAQIWRAEPGQISNLDMVDQGYGFQPNALGTTVADAAGKGISIVIQNNGSGALTGGDDANALIISVQYALLDTTTGAFV